MGDGEHEAITLQRPPKITRRKRKPHFLLFFLTLSTELGQERCCCPYRGDSHTCPTSPTLQPSWGISTGTPQAGLPDIPLLGIYLGEMLAGSRRDICHPMLKVAVVSPWPTHGRNLSVHCWMQTPWRDTQWKAFLPWATTLVHLQGMVLSGINQTQKATFYIQDMRNLRSSNSQEQGVSGMPARGLEVGWTEWGDVSQNHQVRLYKISKSSRLLYRICG